MGQFCMTQRDVPKTYLKGLPPLKIDIWIACNIKKWMIPLDWLRFKIEKNGTDCQN